MNSVHRKKNKKSDFRNKVIKKQLEEIDNLKQTISELEISCKDKENIINSIESIRMDFTMILDDLKEKRKKYEDLIEELTTMKNIFNQSVFKGRWKLIKLLMK